MFLIIARRAKIKPSYDYKNRILCYETLILQMMTKRGRITQVNKDAESQMTLSEGMQGSDKLCHVFSDLGIKLGLHSTDYTGIRKRRFSS